MAKSYLESMLGESEHILYTTKQHTFLLISSILFEIITMLVLLVAAVAIAIAVPEYRVLSVLICFGLMLFPMASMTRDILSWTNHQYVVTNWRVIQIAGIIEKSVTDSSLDKVNDLKLTQTALGRLFNYGDIQILTASETGIDVLKRIDHPIQFKNAMVNAKERLESGENFIHREPASPSGQSDLPGLITQLAELRKQGILSEEEFQTKKKQILAKLG